MNEKKKNVSLNKTAWNSPYAQKQYATYKN